MDTETFIIVVFCLIDDFVREHCRRRKLRQRGPQPVLADSEVLTIEIAGAFLGLNTDQGLYAHFRCYFADLFPGLRRVHRTTFGRQAANLWTVQSALWQHLAAATRHDAAIAVVDSLPVPVCRFARAYRCRCFRGLAAFGYDPLAHQTYYGLRLHLRVSWPGVITAATLAPANDADQAVAPQLIDGLTGWVWGDGGYGSAALHAELAPAGLHLIAPRRGKSVQHRPAWLVQVRRRIETVLSQLTERYCAKQLRPRDLWHLAARWLRTFASHTLAVLLCQQAGFASIAFAKLITI
jgi:DDE family transposase